MSGLAGIIQLNGEPQPNLPSLVLKMIERQAHRGSGDRGFVALHRDKKFYTSKDGKIWGLPFSPPNMVLGHCRNTSFFPGLSAQQPMPSEDKNTWLVFDGQLYDYQDKRREFEQNGFSFRSKTDSEIILHAYQKEGFALEKHLNGKWAYVLYDSETESLIGSRDILGTKPLYYFKNENYFAFASELKAFLDLPFLNKKMNRGAAFDFLVLGKTDTISETWWENVYQIPPGHHFQLHLPSSKLTIQPHTKIEKNTKFLPYNQDTFNAYQDQIRAQLFKNVGQQLQYTSEANSLLSGGIDSSVLVGILNHFQPEKVTALTASYKEAQYNESNWAQLVVQQNKANWLQTFPNSEGLIEDLKDLFYSQDTPTISPGTYAQFQLMRLAKEHGIKAIFDGQGADGLFAGHMPNNPALWKDLIKNFRLGALLKEWNAFGGMGKSLKYLSQNHLKYSVLTNLPSSIRHRFYLNYFKELKYLNPQFLKAHKHRYQLHEGNSMPGLNSMLHNGYFGGDVSFLLKCVDRSAQWHGIETCSPYSTDKTMMELLFQIPGNYKIQKGVRKVLLREAFKDLLPPKVYNRHDKMGLVTPANRWIVEIKDAILLYFENLDSEIINKDLLLKDYHQFFNTKHPVENFRVYKFMAFAIWSSVFLK